MVVYCGNKSSSIEHKWKKWYTCSSLVAERAARLLVGAPVWPTLPLMPVVCPTEASASMADADSWLAGKGAVGVPPWLAGVGLEEADATTDGAAAVEDWSGRERPTLITGAMAVLEGTGFGWWRWAEKLEGGGGGPPDRPIPVVSSPASCSGRPMQVAAAAAATVGLLFVPPESERISCCRSLVRDGYKKTKELEKTNEGV